MPLEYLGAPPVASDRQARPFSPAVRAGDFIYVSGQVPANKDGEIVVGGIEAQTRQVMENLKTALASVGGGFEHVVKLNSYLTNIEANGAEFREVRGSYFPNKQALPASTLVQVPRLANPAFLLEIEAVAILPPKA